MPKCGGERKGSADSRGGGGGGGAEDGGNGSEEDARLWQSLGDTDDGTVNSFNLGEVTLRVLLPGSHAAVSPQFCGCFPFGDVLMRRREPLLNGIIRGTSMPTSVMSASGGARSNGSHCGDTAACRESGDVCLLRDLR